MDFWFFFFGGSGALGIGGAQVPKILKELDQIKALGGKPSLGGPELDTNPLATFGYPEPLRVQDIESIFQNLPDVPTLLSKGDKKTYMSQLGYVEEVALARALPDANPLALRSLYDAVSGGGGGGVISPSILTQKLAVYREAGGVEAFKTDLLVSSMKKNSAYLAFLSLIALVFDLIIESGVNAFL